MVNVRLWEKARLAFFFANPKHFKLLNLRKGTNRQMRFSLPSIKYVWRLFPASDCCRARGNQIVERSSDNETVNGSSRKPGGAEWR